MTDNWRNWPAEQGYRTAHEQNSDGSYHFTVMKADLCVKLVDSEYNTEGCSNDNN